MAGVATWIKNAIGLALLPLCWGLAQAVWRVLVASGAADTFWVATLAGAACWLVVYLLLPRPMWLYVFGHEFTHVLWAWLFGGRVKRFRATARGGSVVVTRNNFLISLAPYFFPVYAVLTVLVFWLADLLLPQISLQPWFHLALGAAYAFHLTLTGHILKTCQSDLTEQGVIFSAAIIWLGNLGVLLLGLPLLAHQTGIRTAVGWWLEETLAVVQWLGQYR